MRGSCLEKFRVLGEVRKTFVRTYVLQLLKVERVFEILSGKIALYFLSGEMDDISYCEMQLQPGSY